MIRDDLDTIRQRDHRWYGVAPTRSADFERDRRALLSYVDELKQAYLDGLDALRAEYDEEIREIEREARQEMDDLRHEHNQEMAEAGAELRGMERELANAEDAAARGGGW